MLAMCNMKRFSFSPSLSYSITVIKEMGKMPGGESETAMVSKRIIIKSKRLQITLPYKTFLSSLSLSLLLYKHLRAFSLKNF